MSRSPEPAKSRRRYEGWYRVAALTALLGMVLLFGQILDEPSRRVMYAALSLLTLPAVGRFVWELLLSRYPSQRKVNRLKIVATVLVGAAVLTGLGAVLSRML